VGDLGPVIGVFTKSQTQVITKIRAGSELKTIVPESERNDR
jgi:hypothetical protein